MNSHRSTEWSRAPIQFPSPSLNPTSAVGSGTARTFLPQAGMLLVLIGLSLGCRSPYYADRGAAMGGLTGAGVGAAVGHASGNTAAGAAIGTAVGALSGALVGHGLDEVRAENEALIEQRLADQRAGTTTASDVVSMTRAGLSDEVIANHIHSQGLAQPMTAGQLISLKQNGVSDGVLRAMQEASATPAAVGVPATTPVVVQQHYIEQPVAVWGPPCPYPVWGPHPRHVHRGRPGVSWGINVRH